MPQQTPTKIAAPATRPATSQKPTAPSPTVTTPTAADPLPLPGMSMKARIMILCAVLLVGALIGAAVFAILNSQPPADPLVASQTALDDAIQNLKASNWRSLDGVTRDDLEGRMLLLDAAIAATDAFSGAVSKLDRNDPENARAYARRDAAVARAKVLRMGLRTIVFLRDKFGHWIYDPIVKEVKWDQPILRDQYVALAAQLEEGMTSLKAASQPVLPPGPPVRHDIPDQDGEPLTQPTAPIQPAPPATK